MIGRTTATAALFLACILPASAEDRYAGTYERSCGEDLRCELTMTAKPGGWHVAWKAARPSDKSEVCSFETDASLGSAMLGPVPVSGIAVGRWQGRPFGVFDLDPGRVSFSASWEACPGAAPKGVYVDRSAKAEPPE
jgi:hypothetical protein